jgi:hypothetical protein
MLDADDSAAASPDIMPFAAIPAFDKAVDKTFPPETTQAMDNDVLALAKFFRISPVSVDNLARDEFTSIQAFSNIVDEEDKEMIIACAQSRANKIGLKRMMQRITAGDLRVEIPDIAEPPKKKKKKLSAANASAATPLTSKADDTVLEADSDDAEATDAFGFEHSEVLSLYPFSLHPKISF